MTKFLPCDGEARRFLSIAPAFMIAFFMVWAGGTCDVRRYADNYIHVNSFSSAFNQLLYRRYL